MIVVCNRVKVNPQHTEAFERLFLSRTYAVDQMPGFKAFQLLRPAKPGDSYIVMVTWESKEYYQAWIESDAFKQGHSPTRSLPEDVFLEPQKIELYEVVEAV